MTVEPEYLINGFSGNAWVIVRLFGSIIMGPEILAPPAEYHGGALLAALVRFSYIKCSHNDRSEYETIFRIRNAMFSQHDIQIISVIR